MPAQKSQPRKNPLASAGRPEKIEVPLLPPLIYAQASPCSIGGVSLFAGETPIQADTVEDFYSEPALIARAVTKLQAAGFAVLQVSPATINIAGSAETYRRAFDTRVIAEERPTLKGYGQDDHATYLRTHEAELPGLISTAGTDFEDVLEGVALEEPRYFMGPSMFAPPKAYWHLNVPGDVSLGCNADRAHRTGITGRGIKVAMVDSGWFQHPYFVERGYRVAPVVLGPGASFPLKDESGHGTGESANVFAVAPDVELWPIKMSSTNSAGAFNAAVALQPDIITCSWGSHLPGGQLTAANLVLAASIAAAVAAGITVIFAAGNGQAGFPGQHPDVIAAGGVFMELDGSLQASNYASGFTSTIYANRRVPDVCGLVGMRPAALYLMLPLEPGDSIDAGNGSGAHPNNDETARNDGWAVFSGTSAAAPQLAGAAALLKQACPSLSPAQIKDILCQSARDVTSGSCNLVPGIHAGVAAAVGPDEATGAGLVDAYQAVLLAQQQGAEGTGGTPLSPALPVPASPEPLPDQPLILSLL